MYFILLAEKKSWRMLERNILGAKVFFRVFDCGLFRLGSRFGGGWHGVSCSASLRPELRALGDNFCSIFFLPPFFFSPGLGFGSPLSIKSGFPFLCFGALSPPTKKRKRETSILVEG